MIFGRHAWLAIGALLWGTLLAPAASAQPYAPDLAFRTLETEHLRIHYHEGYYAFAAEVAKVGEAALVEIHRLLAHQLKDKIELVLSDDTDDANGSATVLPYPIVRGYVTAPDDLSFLAEHQYWTYELIAHELTHIVHLDTTGNVSKVINAVLGRTWMPNQLQSRWFIEGLAVEVESRLSLGGRARSRMVDMVLRAEAIEDRPIRLDQALAGPYRWPQGNSWYLHGGRFLSFVASRYGHEKLQQISHKYGGQLIPFAMNRAFKAVVGKSYDEVWAEFQATLHEGYAQQLAEALEHPIVEGRALTSRGQRNYDPRYLPDGRLLYFAEGYAMIPQLRVHDPVSGEDRELEKISSQGQLSSPEPNGHVVYSMNEVWRTFYSYQDLFDYDLKRGRSHRLSTGLRARDPAVSPDGRFVYFIQNLGVRSRLVRAPLVWQGEHRALGALEVIWDPGRAWQLYAPRLSPDGKQIALSVFRPPGQRDVAILDLRRCALGGDQTPQAVCEARVDWVTDDEALDGGPTFSPDGETLYFHSARSDIYNIYAYSLADGTIKRVTNVMTGAFSPDVSPDGKRLAYMRYSSRGFDVFEAPLDPTRFVELQEKARRAPVAVAPGSLPEAATAEPAALPSQAYNAWKTLLPRSWIVLPSADAYGTVLALAVSGQDPLLRHTWSASVGYGLLSRDLNYSIGYANRQLYPTISVSTSRSIQAAPSAATINGVNTFVAERAHRGELDVSIPLVRALWQLQFSLGYFFEHRERLTELLLRPTDLRPILPPTGNFAGVNASITFSRTRRTAGSISPEYGQRLTLGGSLRETFLGSDFRQESLSLSATHYQLMPWLLHHVLMLRVSGGGGYNELSTRPLTALGGLPLRDPIRDLLFGVVNDSGVRGFAPAAFSGDFFYTGTLEYRAPLWRIERGWSTLPIYLRTLSAAAFVDVANAARLDALFSAIGVGVGGEIRLDLDYGFLYGATLRFGYARGVTANGIDNLFLTVSNGF